MNTYKKFYNYTYGKILLTILITLAVLSFLFFGVSFSFKTAKAENPSVAALSYLSSDKENLDVASPQDVYFSDTVTAIISGTDKLLVCENDGSFTEVDFSEYFSSPNVSQVKVFDEDTLLVFNFGTIEKVKYKENPVVIEDLKDSSNRVISGTNYDINGAYLTVIFGEADNGSCKIYSVNNGVITETASFSGVNGKKPISLNSLNEIFYVSTEQKLCKRSISDILNYEIISDVSPDKMIAEEDFLYLIASGKIYGLDLSDNTLLPAREVSEQDFDLGNIISPSGLCFDRENIVISDSTIPAVQEFSVSVEDDELVLSFTGFAIAKDKTAYNRIGKGGKVQSLNGKVAVLDDYKLTVTKVDFSSPYKKDNFINIIKGSDAVSGYLFDGFVLGETSVLLINTEERTAKEYDFIDGLKETFNFSGTIAEGQYFNGTFYILSTSANNAYVYTVENDTSSLLFTKENVVGSATVHMCIDAYRNIYLSDTVANAIYKFGKADAYEVGEFIQNSSAINVKTLSVDLGGAVFALENDVIAYYSNGERFDIPLTFNEETLSGTSSLALSVFDKAAFITNENDELLRYVVSLPNMAISHIKVPSDFSTSGESADIENLTVFELIDGVETFNIYDTSGEFFSCNGFYYEEGKQFVKVYSLTLTEDYGNERTLTLYIISDGELFIAFSESVTDVTASLISDAEYDKGCVATNVNIYYFPVITDKAEYAITLNDKVLRLTKKTEISPLKQVVFQGKTYLFVKVATNGNEVFGYIPATFLVEVLSENADGEVFVVRQIKYATLYQNSDMTGKICDIENVSVRVYVEHETEKTSYISVDTPTGRIFGYVDKTTVKEAESHNVRNALIIISVSLSVFITSLFFIVRKYKN